MLSAGRFVCGSRPFNLFDADAVQPNPVSGNFCHIVPGCLENGFFENGGFAGSYSLKQEELISPRMCNLNTPLIHHQYANVI
jgi:hypothetical protein